MVGALKSAEVVIGVLKSAEVVIGALSLPRLLLVLKVCKGCNWCFKVC